jgi:hypothetical protein
MMTPLKVLCVPIRLSCGPLYNIYHSTPINIFLFLKDVTSQNLHYYNLMFKEKKKNEQKKLK